MRVLFINKKTIIATALLLVAGLSVFMFPEAREAVVAATKRDLPIYNVSTEEKVVALTFDAAWGNEDTEILIEILGQYDISATFFVVGQWVDNYPESVKALHDAGHEIMSHSNTHPHMPQLEYSKMVEEITESANKIEAITGVRPTLFRPPYGDYDDKLVATLREQEHHCIQWDVDSLDWKDLPSTEITSRVLDKATNGSIILFHNAAKNTPESLPKVIDGLIADGYSFKKVSDLIYNEDFIIDHKGTQIKNT